VFRKITLASYLAFIGCTANGFTPAGPSDGGTGAPDATAPDPDGVVASSKARLQFRGGEIYSSMLARGLELPKEELCRELGLYDCARDVHRIALLGVEPYRTGIIEPLENTVVSTPIAVERVALSACSQWAKRGVAGTRPEIATRLYQRLLQRDPEESEVVHLEALHASMAAEGPDPELDQSWAAMSCFAVATTTEALFY
jgi:hypothetical protein